MPDVSEHVLWLLLYITVAAAVAPFALHIYMSIVSRRVHKHASVMDADLRTLMQARCDACIFNGCETLTVTRRAQIIEVLQLLPPPHAIKPNGELKRLALR